MDKISKIAVLAIVISAFLLMYTASQEESGTTDELAHIPAGYGYVKYLDYRLNPEHPPLVKTIAAFPLLFLNLNFPDKDSAWTSDVNGQWAVGAKFLYESQNDADQIIQWARLGPMLLTLLLIILVYIWSSELLGKWWALLPTFLIGLSPTLLAHGHYVTTDIGATLGIFLALFTFVKFLLLPSRKNLLLAGLVLGMAQLLKFSSVILFPIFVIIAFIYYLLELKKAWPLSLMGKAKMVFGKALAYGKSLTLIFLISLALIHPFYFITTFNYPIDKQVSDTAFILTSFGGGPTPQGENCRPIRCLADLTILAAGNPLTRPYAEYSLGVLMAGQRASGGNVLYFLGEVKNTGGPLYFPIVFLMKEPLPSLILIAIALFITLKKIIPSLYRRRLTLRDYLMTNFAEVAMLVFVLFYVAYSLNSELNIGVRHLLPIMPFLYILTAAQFKSWINGESFKKPVKSMILGLLLAYYAVTNLFNYPFYLSYFNELFGTANGWRYVTDSNYDWGQDLKRLKKFVGNPPAREDIDKIAVDYFGAGSPKYYLGDKAVLWSSAKGNPLESNIKWLAVSVNSLQGAKGTLRHNLPRSPEDEYQWLTNPYEPYARAGKSIFIYKLEAD